MSDLRDRKRKVSQDRAHSRRTVLYRSLAVKEGGVGERWLKERTTGTVKTRQGLTIIDGGIVSIDEQQQKHQAASSWGAKGWMEDGRGSGKVLGECLLLRCV